MDKEFREFLDKVGKNLIKDPAFHVTKAEQDSIPKTWEEMIKRAKELPGDDPISWLKECENGQAMRNPFF